MEKAYLTMKNSGASSITLGIIVLVVGVATGILAIDTYYETYGVK